MMAPSSATRSRLIFAAGMLVAAYFVYTAISGALHARQLADDRAEAEAAVASLEAKKAYLEAVKEYVASDAYVEQEARRGLGYIREGEVPFVVISPPLEEQSEPEGEWWERLFPR